MADWQDHENIMKRDQIIGRKVMNQHMPGLQLDFLKICYFAWSFGQILHRFCRCLTFLREDFTLLQRCVCVCKYLLLEFHL